MAATDLAAEPFRVEAMAQSITAQMAILWLRALAEVGLEDTVIMEAAADIYKDLRAEVQHYLAPKPLQEIGLTAAADHRHKVDKAAGETRRALKLRPMVPISQEETAC